MDMPTGNAEPPISLDATLSQTMARRGFLFRAAAAGIMAVAAPSLLAACEQIADPTLAPTPTDTPVPTPTTFDASAVTPAPSATATATPVPAPTQTPRPVLKTEAARVSHLVRRTSFGASVEELARYRQLGLQGTIDHLVDFARIDDGALDERLAAQEINIERQGALQLWWLQRMAYTKRPLQEKLTLFWHGILTSSFSKTGSSPAMYEQNTLFRDMGMGRYDEMLKAISRDAAMLIYLDSRTNRKASPNENYSRELMELFTLGIGQYTEDDVREAARSFTGWQIKGKTEFLFNERQHDFEDKTFLGETGPWDGDDIVDVIMRQPATAEYVVRRLWEFFAYADPEPEVVSRLAKVFRDNDSEIRPVMRAMFEAEEFYSPRAFQALIKGPAELVASTVRTLGLETTFSPVRRSIEGMGQSLFAPPDVSGWDGGITWINSSTLLERMNLANAIAMGQSRQLAFDPAALAGKAAESSATLVDFYVDLLLGGEIGDETRALLLEHAENLRIPSRSTGRTVPEDERQRSLVYLILASPDYQLA
jgi:uncharacterized protein (DUF1800 family)